MKQRKRLLALLLVAVLVTSLLPVSALVVDEGFTPEIPVGEEAADLPADAPSIKGGSPDTEEGDPADLMAAEDLSIPGYERVTSIPDEGLNGQFLIVAPHSEHYHVLFPGGTAASNENTRTLRVTDNVATGWEKRDGTVDTDHTFEAAEITLTYGDGNYSGSATSAADSNVTYYLFQGTNVVYSTASGTPSSSFTITRSGDNSPYFKVKNSRGSYLLFNLAGSANNFNQASGANANYIMDMLLYKKVETDVTALPGYTRVLSANLDITKEYIIVSKDSDDNLYALVPTYSVARNPGGLNSGPSMYAAKLTVNEGVVSAATVQGGTNVPLANLKFTISGSASSMVFKASNVDNGSEAPIYLNLADQNGAACKGLFGTNPVNLGVTVASGSFTIRNAGANRVLGFNKNGDAIAEYPNLCTDFWGPRSSPFPTYLYSVDGSYVTPPEGYMVSDMFNDANVNNTWAFVGGRAVQGTFTDVGGARNFVGLFEEYIRWTKATTTSGSATMQRYTINLGKTGDTLATIVGDAGWGRVTAVDPKAVVYMVGPEDMTAAEVPDTFATNLTALVTKTMALRENSLNTVAIIVKPYTNSDDADYTAKATAYGAAIDAWYAGLTDAQKAQTKVIAATDMAGDVNEGFPNSAGHVALAKALARGTYGSDADFQEVSANYTTTEEWYDVLPHYSVPESRNAPQQTLANWLDNGNGSYKSTITWLFMGDSITHGAAHLEGYDSISQSFEKFVKEDLNRPGDVIVNTAISGSKATDLINNLNERMTKYHADVVSIMIGTNDSNGGVSAADYKTRLETLVTKAREANPNAIVVLRTPVPTSNASFATSLADYVVKAKEVADAHPDYVIFVDQYTNMLPYVIVSGTTKTFLFNSFFKDGAIHPGVHGHVWMTHQFIEALGLWDANSNICKTRYLLPIDTTPENDTTTDISAALAHNGTDKIFLNLNILDSETVIDRSIMGATISATVGNVDYSATGMRPATIALQFPEAQTGSVPVTVKALVDNGSRGKYITYTATVDFTTQSAGDTTINASDWQAWEHGKDLSGGAEITTDEFNHLQLPAGGTGDPFRPNQSGSSLTEKSNAYIFTNTAINAAMASNELTERYISFNLEPTSSGTPNFGIGINANGVNSAYFLGYDSYSKWYSEAYKPGVANQGWDNGHNYLGGMAVNSGDEHAIRISWTASKVRIWIDGSEVALTGDGSFFGIDASPTVVFKTGTGTSLHISDLHYSGDGVRDSYFLLRAIDEAEAILDEEETYDPATWLTFTAKLLAAKAVLAQVHDHNHSSDLPQEDVDTATSELTAAMGGLLSKIPEAPQPTTSSGYKKVTTATLEEGDYGLVVVDSSTSRILYHTGTGKTDKVTGSADGNLLSFNTGYNANTQQWHVAPVNGGGYTLKSLNSNRYLDMTSASNKNINTNASAVTIQITKVDGQNYYNLTQGSVKLAFDGNGSAVSQGNGNIYATDSGSAAQVYFFKYTENIPANTVSDWTQLYPAPNEATDNRDQPFINGVTVGCGNFRIPGIVTMDDGTLVATADVRWDTAADAYGVDSAASISTDNGASWSTKIVNYYGDSVNTAQTWAVSFMDPVLATDGEIIYYLGDLFVGGSAIGYTQARPSDASGFMPIEHNGETKQRLVLYTMLDLDSSNTSVHKQTDTNWSYYVADYDENGFADVYGKNGAKTAYYIDENYYLFKESGTTDQEKAARRGTEADMIYCQRLGDNSQWVQQNLFFYNSVLHVRNATYLGLRISKDKGQTWSAPVLLNQFTDVLKNTNNGYYFYGAGPGRGVATKEGLVILPCYVNNSGKTEYTSVVISEDYGETWVRGANLPDDSSEAAPVLVGDTLYIFARHHNNYYTSTDHGMTWSSAKQIIGMPAYDAGTQLSAILYSKLIDGKQAIIFSAPSSTRRTNGHLFTLLVDPNTGELSMYNQKEITAPGVFYAYSCLTELGKDNPENNTQAGDIGLLYEDQGSRIRYINVPFSELVNENTVTDAPKVISVTDSYSFAIVDDGMEYRTKASGSSTWSAWTDVTAEPSDSLANGTEIQFRVKAKGGAPASSASKTVTVADIPSNIKSIFLAHYMGNTMESVSSASGSIKKNQFFVSDPSFYEGTWKMFFLGANQVPVTEAAVLSSSLAGTTVKVAALKSAYGDEMWEEIATAFENLTGATVELTCAEDLEDVIGESIQAGSYPDVVHLATGRDAGLTEQFIGANQLHDLSGVLSMTVPGETKKVSEKISSGFTGTSATNPYDDGKTYMAPMFYSPCGLFYNAALFEEKGWEVPTTWDEMWALGDIAKAEGKYLFTYPTTGYFDAFLYSLIYSVGGADFFEDVTHYEDGVWDTANGQKVLEIVSKLATYTHPSTPAQANDTATEENGSKCYLDNQKLVMDNEALFMPNGTWVVGEMAAAEITGAEGFRWGFTALPVAKSGGAQYSYTWMEQAWIPSQASNMTGAEQFVAFLYSDTACKIFANHGAVQPVQRIADMLSGENQLFYSIYENGARAATGEFAPYAAEEGTLGTIRQEYLDPINGMISAYDANDLAAFNAARDAWIARIKVVNGLIHAQLNPTNGD